MEARDIIDKKFNKGLNGYKMEEVDEYLQEVSTEFLSLKKQNEELEKKMEILAEKIREYRKDEDAIKEALLGAQKQSNTVLASAKEKAEKMVSDAKEKSEKMIKDAEDRVKEKDAYGKKLVDDANAEKTKIVAECERKAAEIKANMDAETKKQESIIAKTRDESNSFVERLLKEYQDHISYIKSIPEKCQNQFVLDMKDSLKLAEDKKAQEAAAAKAKPAPPPVAAPAPAAKPAENKDKAATPPAKAAEKPAAPAAKAEEKKEPAKLENMAAKKPEEAVLEKTSEIAAKPVFEEEPVAEEVEEFDESSPLFDKSKRKSKFEKLQFGNNNKNKE